MVNITLSMIAAMLTITLLTRMKNSCKRGYKIFDHIDIHCEIQAVPFSQLSQMQPGEPSAAIRERVIAARKIQEERVQSQHIAEAIGYRNLDRGDWAERGI